MKYTIPSLISAYLNFISRMSLNLYINKFDSPYDEAFKNHYAAFIGGNIDFISNKTQESDYLKFFKNFLKN